MSLSPFYQSLKDGVFNDIPNLYQRSPTSLQEVDENGWQPLHWAARHGNSATIEFLVKSGAPLDAQTKQGYSPLYLAASKGHLSAIQTLQSLGANLNLVDGHLQSALHRACENDFPEVAIFLIQHKADVNLQDMMGRTALHWICSRGLEKVAEELLNHGARLLPTKGGEDPLHCRSLLRASRSGFLNVISIILKYNQDHNVLKKNERNESAVTVAKSQEIHDFLYGRSKEF